MKYSLVLLLIHLSTSVFGQFSSKLNQDLGLSDSLIQPKEVRVYYTSGHTNYTSVFRLYQDKSDKWHAEFFEHYAKVPGQAELKTKRRKLKSKSKMNLVWLNIAKTNIQDLPNMSDINWKLKNNPTIQVINGEETLGWQSTSIIDGKGYDVLFRWGKNFNRINFSNPERYSNLYPSVDELEYFMEFINLIRTEFDVLKE